MKSRAKHGEFGLMHASMAGQFSDWIDEMTARSFGFKLSDLHAAEEAVARLVAINDPTPEAAKARDEAIADYRENWLPKRHMIEGG